MDPTTTSTSRADDHTSIAVEALVVALTLAPFVLLAAVWREFPDLVPVHWNIRGEVDGWSRKNVFSVFALPVIGIYMQGLFLLLKGGIREMRPAPPAAFAEPWMRVKAEQARAYARLFDWIRVSDGLLVAAIACGIAAGAVERYRSLTWVAVAAALAAAALLVVVLGYWIVKLFRLKGELEKLPAPPSPRPEDDDANWPGGLVYYNPADPALFVEKRLGVGYTFNMANKRVYWYVAYLLGLPILIGAAVMLL